MTLPNGEEWLFQPVDRGWCRYESLKDGTLDLADIAAMNEAIAVKLENERRMHLALKNQR